MAELYFPPTQNGLQKTLDAQLNVGVTTQMTLNNTTGVQNKPGVVVIDRIDASGAEKSSAVREYVSYTGVSGNNLTGLTRGLGGSTDQDHAVGSIVEFIPDVTVFQAINDVITTEHSTSGTHDATKVAMLAGTQTFTGAKTFGSGLLKATRPQITTSIDDANGNEVIEIPATASAVNQVKVTNAATGDAPDISATGGDTNIDLKLTAKGTGVVKANGVSIYNLPQGTMFNGKISATVASNNLTVAVKGMDGNDPSATNPVYVRVGDTVRKISAALSVTKNAGTNWCNSGSTELAAKEVDYFVYIGYNATDGVVIGFARIPYARVYGDFSTTPTAERYAAISTITNAASTDEYEVIGRFNATLSAAASYNWSIPATAVVVNRPIFETRWLQWAPVYTGFSANPTGNFYYRIRMKECQIMQETPSTDGTSNSTSFTFTAPFSCERANLTAGLVVLCKDNNTLQDTPAYIRFATAASSTITALRTNSNGNWTSSSTKNVYWRDWNYEID